MTEIDEIEIAAATAEAETGARGSVAKIALCRSGDELSPGRRWTATEDAFLRDHHGKLTWAAMAVQLGRTVQSIANRVKRDLHLPAPSKAPTIVTAEQIAWGLGMACGKSVHRLIDQGILPGRRLPGPDVTRVVDRAALLRWMLEPRNWIYYRPERVGTLRGQGRRPLAIVYDYEFWAAARRLVMRARREWEDEWLTPGQVTRELRLKGRCRALNKAIHAGVIPAVRWGNWWIRRSDLPMKGLTINAYGQLVPMSSIGRKNCRVCRQLGHIARTCPRREA